MIYIVTGDGPRCGSTMFVKALCEGGMTAACSEDHQDVLEISLHDQESIGFPRNGFENYVIKFFGGVWGRINSIVPGEYKAVWLHRPSEERWSSFHKKEDDFDLMKWTGGNLEEGRQAELYRDSKSLESLGILKMRSDVQLIELQYHEVCKNPLKAFTLLKKSGWPIDPKKASTVPKVQG